MLRKLSRLRLVLPAACAMFLNATPALAQRVNSPTESTVFIRVIGKIELEVVDAVGQRSVEERDIELGTGSGFVFTPYGHVLTNHHVIDDESFVERILGRDVHVALEVSRVEVVFPGGASGRELARFEASVDAVDPELDLAVLSIPGGDLPYLGLGDSDAIQQGSAVRVYGFPFGRKVEMGKGSVPESCRPSA